MKNTLMTMVYVVLSFILIFILMNIYLLPGGDGSRAANTATSTETLEVNVASANGN
jgi:hypothetical protein